MFTSGSKLWLFIHLARYMKCSTFETKSLHSQNSYVGYWNVIHGLTKIRYVGLNWFKLRCFHLLIEGVRLGTWNVRRLNGAWVGIIGLKIERMPQIHLKLRFCRLRRSRISRSLSFPSRKAGSKSVSKYEKEIFILSPKV